MPSHPHNVYNVPLELLTGEREAVEVIVAYFARY